MSIAQYLDSGELYQTNWPLDVPININGNYKLSLLQGWEKMEGENGNFWIDFI